jgi:hypothetical protein
MNSFWSQLYDRSKDRRYAVLFLVTLFIFFGLVVPGVVFCLHAGVFDSHPGYLLPGIGGLFLALIWKAFRWLRAQRRVSSTFSPLSRDEWRKARSKLVKDRTYKKL